MVMSLSIAAQSRLKTKSITVFKNGQSFIVKEGNVKTTNNIYSLTEVPNALFGTLWFNSSTSKINQVTSQLDSLNNTIETEASSFSMLLSANKGKQVTITTSEQKVYNGIIETFNNNNEDPNNSPILILKSNNKWFSIDPKTIIDIEFTSQPETIARIEQKQEKPVVNIQFANTGTQNLEMMYLQDGLSWVPTYLLELISDKKAKIKLQAELKNNTEDINDTDISLVVGVPNFMFANQAAVLTSFDERESTRYSSSSNLNYLTNQIVGSVTYSEKRSNNDEVNNADAVGDFYFYPIKQVNIKKNGRGTFPLFETEITIKHVYECILDKKEEQRNKPRYSFDPTMSDVYHTIIIDNNTKQPFTTGSVLVYDKESGQPLTEDILKYTANGQSSSIKITTTPDIKVTEQEKIIESVEEEKKVRRYNQTYTLNTIEAEVVITNSKNEDIELLVKKTLDGKIQKSTIKYSDRQMPNEDSDNINPIDYLDFNIKIKAGETYKFTYTYKQYLEQ